MAGCEQCSIWGMTNVYRVAEQEILDDAGDDVRLGKVYPAAVFHRLDATVVKEDD